MLLRCVLTGYITPMRFCRYLLNTSTCRASSKVWEPAYSLALSVGAQEHSCEATSSAPCSPCRNCDRLQAFMCSQNSFCVASSIAT
jgi:hypothetical protein